MTDIHMRKPLKDHTNSISLPEDYSIITITEDNCKLWEEVMDKSWGNHPAGSFRHVLVANNYYEEDRVYVMLNHKKRPVATATYLNCGHTWTAEDIVSLIFVGVIKEYQGRKLGQIMVNYVLKVVKDAEFSEIELSVAPHNNSAIRTYLNCGFIPKIQSQDEFNVWAEHSHLFDNADYLNKLQIVQLTDFEKVLNRLNHELPHPPRPWPDQIQKFSKAIQHGENYLFGCWYKFNLYKVDTGHYINLKNILKESEHYEQLVLNIYQNKIRNVFIDSEVSPKEVFIEQEDGKCHLIGISKNTEFKNGVKDYIEHVNSARQGSCYHLKLL